MPILRSESDPGGLALGWQATAYKTAPVRKVPGRGCLGLPLGGTAAYLAGLKLNLCPPMAASYISPPLMWTNVIIPR